MLITGSRHLKKCSALVPEEKGGGHGGDREKALPPHWEDEENAVVRAGKAFLVGRQRKGQGRRLTQSKKRES